MSGVLKFLLGIPVVVVILVVGAWLLTRRSPTIMTYEEALRFFTTERPKDRSVVKGMIYRKPQFANIEITRAFLDAEGNVVLSKRDIVGRLDQELADAFGPNDLIVVE